MHPSLRRTSIAAHCPTPERRQMPLGEITQKRYRLVLLHPQALAQYLLNESVYVTNKNVRLLNGFLIVGDHVHPGACEKISGLVFDQNL